MAGFNQARTTKSLNVGHIRSWAKSAAVISKPFTGVPLASESRGSFSMVKG